VVHLASASVELQCAPLALYQNFFVLLSLLIPGQESVTSEVFDVYLEPVVDEFLDLWVGVSTYDITKAIGCKAF